MGPATFFCMGIPSLPHIICWNDFFSPELYSFEMLNFLTTWEVTRKGCYTMKSPVFLILLLPYRNSHLLHICQFHLSLFSPPAHAVDSIPRALKVWSVDSSSSGITWEFTRDADSHPTLDLMNQSGSSLMWFLVTHVEVKFEKHWSTPSSQASQDSTTTTSTCMKAGAKRIIIHHFVPYSSAHHLVTRRMVILSRIHWPRILVLLAMLSQLFVLAGISVFQAQQVLNGCFLGSHFWELPLLHLVICELTDVDK